MGQFATCSDNPHSRKQRDDVYKAVTRFQTLRFSRTESFMREGVTDDCSSNCWQRRRLATASGSIPAKVSPGQIMLTFDASFRKAYAESRRYLCLSRSKKAQE